MHGGSDGFMHDGVVEALNEKSVFGFISSIFPAAVLFSTTCWEVHPEHPTGSIHLGMQSSNMPYNLNFLSERL